MLESILTSIAGNAIYRWLEKKWPRLASRLPFPVDSIVRSKHINNLPYPPLANKMFRGRSKDMHSLREIFDKRRSDGSSTQVVIMHGLGGEGKTRLSVEFAWRRLLTKASRIALFVKGNTPEQLETEVANLVALVCSEVEPPAEQPKRLAMVYRALNESRGWFLIVDNVDSKKARTHLVNEILPRIRVGQVIVTTRMASWPVGFTLYELSPINLDDAVIYLIRSTQTYRRITPDDNVQARKVATTLDRLPLALELAAAYIRQMRISFTDYQERFNESRKEILHWYELGVTYHAESIATAWNTTVAQLGIADRTILRIASFFGPDAIPRQLFEQHAEILQRASDKLAEETNVSRSYSLDVPVAIGSLASWSMIHIVDEVFFVHRLVQQSNKVDLSTEESSWWNTFCFDLIHEYIPANAAPYENCNWPLWRSLELHIATLYETSSRHNAHSQNEIRVVLGLATFQDATSRYRDAERLYRELLELQKKLSGNVHPNVAMITNNLGSLLEFTGDASEAASLLREAVTLKSTLFGPMHPETARTMLNFVGLLIGLERREEAEPLCRKVIDILRHTLGSEDVEVARALINLSSILAHNGEVDEAQQVLDEAIGIFRSNSEEDSPELAVALRNLGEIHYRTGRSESGEKLTREALAVAKKQFGENHKVTADALDGMCRFLIADRRFEEVIQYARQALEIRLGIFGDSHKDVGDSIMHILFALYELQRFEEALPLAKRAHDVFLKCGDSGKRGAEIAAMAEIDIRSKLSVP